MKKLFMLLMTFESFAEARYIQGIDNGSYKVYASEAQSIREFKTLTDGYVNIVPNPTDCPTSLMLLDAQNRMIGEYKVFFQRSLNVGIPAGQYYIQVIPRKDCTINVALP